MIAHGSAFPVAKLALNNSVPPILMASLRMGLVLIILIPFWRFKIPKKNHKNKYKLNNIKIEISYYENFKNLNSYDDKSISIILDGKIVSDKKKTVITTGEIVKSYTLKQLTNYFKINDKILLLKASKMSN